MKLIYIANIRLPTEKAHGLQIMKTCEALARQGIEVELTVPRRKNHLKDDSFDFYGIPKDLFKITRLRCWDLVSLGKLGFWIESWTFYWQVKNYLKKHTTDVYYTRDLPLAYWLSKKFHPVYYEIHTLPDKVSSKYKEAWNRCNGLIVISNGLKKDLLKNSVEEKKILVVRDAVDLQEFTIKESKENCRKKLGLPLSQTMVVYTGHLYKWKGADLLADVVHLVPQYIHLYLIGGTKKEIYKFRKTYQADNLHIIGWQPHILIPYWLKAADLLVLPNSSKLAISTNYTSPLKLFEYMASRTPMLLANLPSIREVAGSYRKYFEPDNLQSLASGIQTELAISKERKLVDDWVEKEIKKHTWQERAINIKNFICQK